MEKGRMENYKDRLGNVINLDDRIVYGVSNRYDPIHTGVVIDITENGVVVLGDGNTKTGLIRLPSTRIVVIT